MGASDEDKTALLWQDHEVITGSGAALELPASIGKSHYKNKPA